MCETNVIIAQRSEILNKEFVCGYVPIRIHAEKAGQIGTVPCSPVQNLCSSDCWPFFDITSELKGRK